MIIGCCGAGKSTLARIMHDIIGLPLYHLDQYYWKEDWTETPKEEWTPIVEKLAAKEKWIIDGNYGGTMDIRMSRADTVIYLDFSTFKCLSRVIKRVWKYHGEVRPDMPDGCRERFDLDFLHYVATYNIIRRKSLINKCDAFTKRGTVIRIRSEKDLSKFLDKLKTGYSKF